MNDEAVDVGLTQMELLMLRRKIGALTIAECNDIEAPLLHSALNKFKIAFAYFTNEGLNDEG